MLWGSGKQRLASGRGKDPKRHRVGSRAGGAVEAEAAQGPPDTATTKTMIFAGSL